MTRTCDILNCNILSRALLLAVAFCLAGCDRDGGDKPVQNHAIAFSTQVAGQGASRGTLFTADAGSNPILEMTVTALYGGTSRTDGLQSYIYGLDVTREKQTSGLTAWEYYPAYYWPGAISSTNCLHFIAYTPVATAVNGIVASAKGSNTHTITYTTPADIANQPDLMTAATSAYNENAAVSLTFDHVLSAHKFVIGEKMVPGVNITKITFKDILTVGTFDYSSWSGQSTAGTITYGDGEQYLYTSTGLEAEKGVNVLGTQCFMLVPQTAVGTIEVTYIYNGLTKVKAYNIDECTGESPAQWKQGKTYTYRMSFESGGLLFDVTSGITAWKDGESTDNPVYNW